MKNKNTKILILICCLIFLVVAVFTKGFGLFRGDEASPALERGGIMTIPLSEVSENAKWYEYNGRKFFTVKDSNGTIKTAFDACDVCYRQRKGYRQEGDDMVCNNCGLRFAINGLGTENKNPGGCWPGYLPNIIEGDNVVIKISDLVKNQQSRTQSLEEECDPETGFCPVL